MNELSAFAGSEGYAACDAAAKRENYVSYIASRPRAQHTGAHALFTGSDDPLVLSRIADDVAHHPGNVWLPIISLHREDAARLGYDDAERWRTFLSGYAMEMARAMKIPWEQFRWYAAFHDEAHHPHVHMVCYSADGKSGYLTKDGIAQIKSGLTKQIFRQELHELYEQQTQRRDELAQEAGAVLAELVQQMQAGTLDNPHIEQLMENLARRLKTCSGKKQYGYLKTPLKSVVDEIVDELAKGPRVASAYGLWYELREEVLRSYKNDLPERLPLSQQKEFKRIKNLVIQEALRLNELDAVFLPEGIPQDQVEDDGHGDDETPVEEPLTTEDIPQEFNPPEAVPPAMAWSSRYRQARLFLFGGDACPQDFAQAFDLFMEEAHAGNALAMHDLGRMYADGLGLECDEALAQEWLTVAVPSPSTRWRQSTWLEKIFQKMRPRRWIFCGSPRRGEMSSRNTGLENFGSKGRKRPRMWRKQSDSSPCRRSKGISMLNMRWASSIFWAKRSRRTAPPPSTGSHCPLPRATSTPNTSLTTETTFAARLLSPVPRSSCTIWAGCFRIGRKGRPSEGSPSQTASSAEESRKRKSPWAIRPMTMRMRGSRCNSALFLGNSMVY